jgi:SAM-dependent methyltransferase
MTRDPTAFVREHYDRAAVRYDTLIQVPERLLFADGRQWATSQASGDVLEITVGTGRNLPHYPVGTRVTGIDLSSGMVHIAHSRAEQAAAEIARVLRPGGRLVLLEHVRSPSSVVRAAQRLLEPLLLRLEGDHLLRHPQERVQAAGLQIDLLERSKLGIVLRLRAHKPS